MKSKKYGHEYFKNLLMKKQPVYLEGLSPTKNGKIFFNELLGSSAALLHENLSFDHSVFACISVSDILSEEPDGTFAVKGQIKWTGEARSVMRNGYSKSVRHAKFVDQAGDAITISIWGGLIEKAVTMKTLKITKVAVSHFRGVNLTTTWDSDITEEEDDVSYAWENIPVNENKSMCCPTVLAAKVEQYFICIFCKKKLERPSSKITKVSCGPCKRSMPIKRCKLTTFCEITFDYAHSQITLTAFNDVVANFFGENLNVDQLEDCILEMGQVDIFYDNRRVIQKLQNHDDSKDI